jgi:GT2 family glycosyltransferase
MSKDSFASIVIPNWNGRALLEKNLPSILLAKKNKKNRILEIIIVDDGSTDDSVAFLKKEYATSIRLIKHTKNRGFASAVNNGVRMAKGAYVCLLNTDVIPSKNFLESTLTHFTDKNVFSVVFHEENAGPAVGFFMNGFIEHKGGKEAKNETISFWASGGSAIFRRSQWMELKGFDEELLAPFYWEDVDLGYRAWKRGYKILWEPKSHVIHKHESTINKNSFQVAFMNRVKERNQLLVIWKNITSEKMFASHIQGLIHRIVAHPGYIRVVIDALRHRKLVLSRRAREKKECTISDEAVFAKFSI